MDTVIEIHNRMDNGQRHIKSHPESYNSSHFHIYPNDARIALIAFSVCKFTSSSSLTKINHISFLFSIIPFTNHNIIPLIKCDPLGVLSDTFQIREIKLKDNVSMGLSLSLNINNCTETDLNH